MYIRLTKAKFCVTRLKDYTDMICFGYTSIVTVLFASWLFACTYDDLNLCFCIFFPCTNIFGLSEKN